jgi:hypothetical protein
MSSIMGPRSRLGRMYPEGHPLRPFLLEAIGRVGPRQYVLTSFLRACQDAGRSWSEVDVRFVRSWLVACKPSIRMGRVTVVRRFYRVLIGHGMAATDPTAGLHVRAEHIRSERRLPDEDVRRLVATVRDEMADERLALASARDLVAIGLVMWLRVIPPRLLGLRWGDLSPDCRSLRMPAGGPKATPLPDPLADAIEDFRSRLTGSGLDLVPEDALLPAIGPRVRFEWLADERGLLLPMKSDTLYRILHDRISWTLAGRGGFVPRLTTGIGGYTNALWLQRESPESFGATFAPPVARRVRVRRAA